MGAGRLGSIPSGPTSEKKNGSGKFPGAFGLELTHRPPRKTAAPPFGETKRFLEMFDEHGEHGTLVEIGTAREDGDDLLPRPHACLHVELIMEDLVPALPYKKDVATMISVERFRLP